MMITDELIEAVKAELLAHGEFGSSSAASEQNAEIAAKAVLEIALSASPAGVVKPLEEYERQEEICTEKAMSQWERSLKRPDMQEKDRVRGAVEAYKRQALAFRMLPPAPEKHLAALQLSERLADQVDHCLLGYAISRQNGLSIDDAMLQLRVACDEFRAALATTEANHD